ncbi:glycoside hydrolase family 3 C-terminal domain-containing protein [Asanoa sp. WMMD1127]|uniref:beta-glucosidase family protein n=1 Tax=Asanoa sp. WMMD1127 TaxID=3016107 RepID=UPI0024164228|nr:glycoside hydrolase family 3 C-terminal domain-containing protein [Asanoa sp. WMMD1127]MDG4825521.1 glycoside hydrolase family 3 C-terminal domain-containing protein [Asanoa sp. WMMD1127]
MTDLDLRAKVRLLTGASVFTLAPEPAVGLHEVRLSDGPTGVRGLTFSGGPVVSLFPNATLLAAAWSEDVAHEVGRLLAEEAMAQRIHVVLGPTINLHRSPLGGRLFEAYSEDPLLTGRLAAAYVRGMQANGVAACLKHLVANESETDRTTVDSVVDEATLREVYLLPFEIAVAEADAWSVMAAYNDVNGVPATEQHHVINEILKGEWGWTGLVVSDWFATKSAAPAANGGLDLVMPGPDGPWGDALVAAVGSGAVAESVVNDHVARLLRLADRVGALGTPRAWPADLPAPDSPTRREQLTRLAAAGMTVLTNRAGALPLRRGETVALVGRHALETIGMGGGSAQVNPPHQVSVTDGLTALLGTAVTVTDGVEVRSRPVPARPDFLTDLRFTLRAGDGSVLDTRGGAATVVGFDDGLAGRVATIDVEGRFTAGGPVEVGGIGAGSWRLRAGTASVAHDLAVPAGGFGAEILAPPAGTSVVTVAPGDVLSGSVTLPAGHGPLSGVGRYAVVARPAPRDADEVIAAAAAAGAAADVAVVVVGLTEEEETEAVDKHTLRLPGRQDDLVSAVAAAARRTVVVVNAATPVLMPWRDEVDAILWVGLPGQEGGHAVAAALLGDVEPAGRLVTTFPAADGASPAWSVTPVDGKLPYTEGTFVGYRGHHAGRASEPAFWFGHGLGYGAWAYADAAWSGDALTVSVTNTGGRAGREVVQVYFAPSEQDQPVRLVGWQAVEAAPGESVTVTVTGDRRLWRRWAGDGWATLSGSGRLLVARGLGDVRAAIEV